jgi:hypothetical protein
MKDLLTVLVLQQKAKERITLPIKYWEAWSKKANGDPYLIVDRNNSLPLLRAKYGNRYLYKAVR